MDKTKSADLLSESELVTEEHGFRNFKIVLRKKGREYVTHVFCPGDKSYCWGHYFLNLDAAILDFEERCNKFGVDHSIIKREIPDAKEFKKDDYQEDKKKVIRDFKIIEKILDNPNEIAEELEALKTENEQLKKSFGADDKKLYELNKIRYALKTENDGLKSTVRTLKKLSSRQGKTNADLKKKLDTALERVQEINKETADRVIKDIKRSIDEIKKVCAEGVKIVLYKNSNGKEC